MQFERSELYRFARYSLDPPSGPLSAHLEVYANFAMDSTRLGSIAFAATGTRAGRGSRRREMELEVKRVESGRGVTGSNANHTANQTTVIPPGTRALLLRVRLAATTSTASTAGANSRKQKQSSRSSPISGDELADTESVCSPTGDVRWLSERSRMRLSVALLDGNSEEWERARESMYVFVDALLLSVLSVCTTPYPCV